MISIIVAVAENGVIGGGNTLLWHISEDLQRFKRITQGHPVIMGRKTFESLGRPLPNRQNVVITRQHGYCPEGVTTVSSLEEAIAMFHPSEEIFITGGGEIYTQAMPMAGKLYLTTVMHDYEGDTHFPEWDRNGWIEVFSEYHERGKDFPYPFEYTDWVRTTADMRS